MIKGMVFDLDGVYFHKGKQEFVEKLCSTYDLTGEEVKEVIFESDMMSRYAKGTISSHEFWNYATEEWNIEASRDDFMELFQRAYEINPKIKELIHTLKGKGYKILACSNNYKDRVKALQEKFNFLEDFDAAVFSFEHHIFKPDLYEKVLDASSLKPEEVFVLDDDEEMLKELEDRKFRTAFCEDPGEVKHLLKEREIL